MSKQNNFRLSKTKNNILYILSGAALALFAGLMLFPTINETTHAEGDEPDDGISITVNGEVDANLVLFDEGDYKIAKDTVSVSSSAAYGYELFLTTDSETHQSIYLNDDPTSESRIAPVSGTIAEPAVLTGNTWGFAIAGQGNFDNEYNTANPDPASRFAIIPTTDDQQAVFENAAATAEDNIDFYYGIKVEPTLEVGRYTTGATYTAIAKEKPRIAKAILGENNNLNFVYDKKEYSMGETYTDNLGETTIVNIYEIPMNNMNCNNNTQMPWYSKMYSIVGVNIDATFADARPTSTCAWFSALRKVTTISNPQNINTSNVVNMSRMFSVAGYDVNTFDLDLGSWDTSNVTDMSSMFSSTAYYAKTWNIRGLGNWNTSNVTNMSGMFYNAAGCATTWDFGNINNWDTSSVTSTYLMFYQVGAFNATEFDLDLSDWDMSSVNDMSFMFRDAGKYATSFNLDLSGWTIGGDANLYRMFLDTGHYAATFNLNLSEWDAAGVVNMSEMFYNAGYSAPTFSLNLNGWKTGDVTNMSNMFSYTGYKATNIDLDLSGWNTSNVTDMSGMFSSVGYSATTFNLELTGWDTSNVTDMSGMFSYAGYNATNMSISGLGGWDTGGVTTMSFMFNNAGYKATTWSIDDLSSWDTGSVTNMQNMFSFAGHSSTTWIIGDLGSWDVSAVSNVNNMFYDAGYYATTWDIGNISGWNVTKVTNHTSFIDLNVNQSNASVVNNQPNWPN